MRVIAGTAKRIALKAPEGSHTRPTSDRAKEGLFNILAMQIQGTHFLDLFCGSGAIGIEALSRGAETVVFAEQNKEALRVLEKNLSATKLLPLARVLPLSATHAIHQLQQEAQRFDMIFLDPPYYEEYLQTTLTQITEAAILKNNGTSLVIAETEAKHPLPTVTGLTLTQQRDYGKTRFLFYRLTNEASA
jgi:16S rRNA (guanine(966)-N(2))-methyltransferase RsmD